MTKFDSTNIEDIYPLSPMQEGLFFHSLYAPKSGVYVEILSFRIEGDLDLETFEQSWQQIVTRHSLLRTAFFGERKQPLQTVLRQVSVALSIQNWHKWSPEAQQQGLDDLIAEEKITGFNFSQPPLMRLHLIELGTNQYQFIWSHHHILLDGWSIPLIFADFFAIYNALANNQSYQLPVVRPYKNYIAWLQKQNLRAAQIFWKQHLKGLETSTRLDIQQSSKSNDHTKRQGIKYFELSSDKTAALKLFAQRHKLTVNNLVQAAWAILLSRYSGESDVIFGITVSGRPPELSGIESMVGIFINTLPMRVKVTPEENLTQWLKTFPYQQIELESYAYTPLVEIQSQSHIPSSTPIFNSIIVFENYPIDEFVSQNSSPQKQSGLKIVDIQFDEQTNYPLTLAVRLTSTLSIKMQYEKTYFDTENIEKLGIHLQNILGGILDYPNSQLKDLPMLTQAELNQQLVLWNDTTSDYPKHQCIHQLFEAQVSRTPDATAIVFESQQLTYYQLNQRANQLARHLQSLGVEPEVLVGICIERSLEMVIGLLAILKAGGAYVPLDPNYPQARLSFMLEDAQVKVFLTSQNLLVQIPDTPSPKLCLDSDWSQISVLAEHNLKTKVQPSNLAYIIYTSGSTGKPKGTMISHQGAVNYLSWSTQYYAVAKGNGAPVQSSIGFDATITSLFSPLLVGQKVELLPESQEIQALAEKLQSQKDFSLVKITPAHLEILRELLPQKTQIDHTRALVIGGEALLSKNLDFWFKLTPKTRIINEYGPTETVVGCCVYEVQDQTSTSGSVPIGRPIANTQIYILNSQRQPVPIGVVGEIYIGGDGLARGYLNRPKLTAEKFIINPFDQKKSERIYRTGDLGRYLPDGNIEYLSRIDSQLKLRGFRIELEEIAAVLTTHPQINQATVIAVAENTFKTRLVAYIVANSEFETQRLREYLKVQLPEYMVPSAFITLDNLPLTPNGKIDRQALPEADINSYNSNEYILPQTKTEEKIAAVLKEVLQLDKVSINENFFELGANSITLVAINNKLQKLLSIELPLVDLFTYPNIKSLSQHIVNIDSPDSLGTEQVLSHSQIKSSINDSDIAVIGLTGRFPQAGNIDAFWQNLKNGTESISFFSEAELLEEGVSLDLIRNPNYVRARAILSNTEMFDGSFFGVSPKEAELIDPQQRLFLESAWEVIENAGYDPEKYSGSIGVYAGTSSNSYLLNNIYPQFDSQEFATGYQLMLSSDKDFLSTRVSYKLNLKGPAVNVQTACSTSLVAVHIACQSLLNEECDMALAGGVSIITPQKTGYLYSEGMIASRDGHCRAFDSKANGILGGNGLGIVLLKRMKDAIADKDCIHAVIKGSAINNDGAVKVGYTAPSTEGQAAVIARAQAAAKVNVESINYIEAHGTGTKLGDPIEIAALTKAFRKSTDKKQFCAIGSLKTNIGHLDAAAGVGGLLKTILILKNRQIPPSLNFEEPSPNIDFANSPFYVNTALSEWNSNGNPRRAGVSSFGIGGTNAHVILEEAPLSPPSGDSRKQHLLLISAKSISALEQATANLGKHLQENPDINLADIAFTLSCGRRAFKYRRFLVSQSTKNVVNTLSNVDSRNIYTNTLGATEQPVVFMFPGQGCQYLNMTLELYETEFLFREQVDLCAEILRPELELDLRQILYPQPEKTQIAEQQLQQTAIAQVAIFVLEYALAKLWQSWGVSPQAMIGHSIGEYVAATLAGVFSLDAALCLVAARGKMMQQLPVGAMLSISIPAEKVKPLLTAEISLAAINEPCRCVVSGSVAAIEILESKLASQSTEFRRLHTSHAFHSQMMEPILDNFKHRVEQESLKTPQVPYVSNLTGDWITEAQATDANYWVKHLRQTVLFAQGIEKILSNPLQVLLEVGPGRTLASLAKRHPARNQEQVILTSVRHPQEDKSDVAGLLTTVGDLWLAGVNVDWLAFYAHEERYRVPLPTYPFERQRYWVSPPQAKEKVHSKKQEINKISDISQWFYIPSWKRVLLPLSQLEKSPGYILLFADEYGLGEKLTAQLTQMGEKIICVRASDSFTKQSEDIFTVNPQQADDYHALINELVKLNLNPKHVIHLWSLTQENSAENSRVNLDYELFNQAQDLGFYSLLFLVQALGKQALVDTCEISVISNQLFDVTGDDNLSPEKATLLGLIRIISQEYFNFNCRCIDVVVTQLNTKKEKIFLNNLIVELITATNDQIVAYRGKSRWIESFEPFRLQPTVTPDKHKLKQQGIYLVTSGLSNIGLVLAEYLAKSFSAKLVLVDNSSFPERSNWSEWIENHNERDEISQKIQKLKGIKALGTDILIEHADVANFKEMQSVIEKTENKFGAINGVIYTAVTVKNNSINNISKTKCEQQFSSIVKGVIVLKKLLANKSLDFCLLMSSLSSILGGLGLVTYGANNNFLDSFVNAYSQKENNCPWITVNWDRWQIDQEEIQNDSLEQNLDKLAISSEEGVKAFELILSGINTNQVVVSTGNLELRINKWIKRNYLQDESDLEKLLVTQPTNRRSATNAYVAPQNQIDVKVIEIFQALLGNIKIGINDNFFELGGDSLIGTMLTAKIKQTFTVNINVSDVFRLATVSQISEYIANQQQSSQNELQRISEILEIVDSLPD